MEFRCVMGLKLMGYGIALDQFFNVCEKKYGIILDTSNQPEPEIDVPDVDNNLAVAEENHINKTFLSNAKKVVRFFCGSIIWGGVSDALAQRKKVYLLKSLLTDDIIRRRHDEYLIGRVLDDHHKAEGCKKNNDRMRESMFDLKPVKLAGFIRTTKPTYYHMPYQDVSLKDSLQDVLTRSRYQGPGLLTKEHRRSLLQERKCYQESLPHMQKFRRVLEIHNGVHEDHLLKRGVFLVANVLVITGVALLAIGIFSPYTFLAAIGPVVAVAAVCFAAGFYAYFCGGDMKSEARIETTVDDLKDVYNWLNDNEISP